MPQSESGGGWNQWKNIILCAQGSAITPEPEVMAENHVMYPLGQNKSLSQDME